MSSQIKPSAGYVLIRDKNTNKIGDFEIVSDEKEGESTVGEVVECGEPIPVFYCPDGTPILKECPCKKGDIIFYPKYHNIKLTWEGEEYRIVKFEDVVAEVK